MNQINQKGTFGSMNGILRKVHITLINRVITGYTKYYTDNFN